MMYLDMNLLEKAMNFAINRKGEILISDRGLIFKKGKYQQLLIEAERLVLVNDKE